MDAEQSFRDKFALLGGVLDERARRLVAAAEALSMGLGGVSAASRASGLARSTIRRGIRDLASGERLAAGRVRRPGAGPKRRTDTDPTLIADLEGLVESEARGDPQSPLRWTIKSVRRVGDELVKKGHAVSRQLVAELLHAQGYSLQANRKVREGRNHPDRNAQFEYINARAKAHLRSRDPVISVDAKKKELVGDFENAGREWHPKGEPEEVRVHDFVDKELGKALPYGVYDVAHNVGWVSVGVDHDTAQFAVATIRRWWRELGRDLHPRARRILIVADGGGSNGYRVRLWKWELQKLADETGLKIRVSHLPPGTSKWNKIEHRLFSFISQNWRGKPLLTRATVVNLIANTTTRSGLRVHAFLDAASYPAKIKIAESQMKSLHVTPDPFHGEWNYTIKPRTGDRGAVIA